MLQKHEETLFALALEKPADMRPAFLDAVCAGDPALRQRLEALLASHDKSEESSPKAAPAIVATIKLDLADTPDEAVGQTLGRYKLLEKVGEGGCGVVYVAEQTQPVRRRVALKVIKLGMDTKAVVARFEAERQALAMMDHPNIAKVLDAGTTETGRPFFVMELVRGIRITEYCDQNNLTTTERLDLFIKVCQAIQHAHQKGIIHRDIKPSNILVTMHDGVPVPKVIDFGIAKATEGRLTDSTVYTQLHQFIGTPAYMSPEQAEMSGLDVDTRSDIYSLGVLLYELLAGSTPFDAKELMAQGISGFVADGNKLIAGSSGDNLLHEWDSTTGRELQSWPLPSEQYDGAMGVSPDERFCVALGYEGHSILRNLADESQRSLDIGVMEAGYATFFPDGKLFAVTSDLGFVRVWDTVGWRQAATIGGYFNSAHSAAFSPDGKRLAMGGGNKEAVKLCDTESWQDVLTLEGRGSDFQSMAFSPDGNVIGWLNRSRELHLWRAPSWEEIAAVESKNKQP